MRFHLWSSGSSTTSATASSQPEGEVSQESLMMNSLVSSVKHEFGWENVLCACLCVCVGLNRISCGEASSDTWVLKLLCGLLPEEAAIVSLSFSPCHESQFMLCSVFILILISKEIKQQVQLLFMDIVIRCSLGIANR